MTVRPGLVLSISAALVVALGACAAKPVLVNYFYAEVPRSSITAITLRHTACFGTCPTSTLRLSADGRATLEGDGRTMFDGDLYAARRGRFRASVDFEQLAAWVDSQHPETLADHYGNVADAPEAVLQIARGKNVKTTSAVLSLAPSRFVGIVFALEGASQHLRWRRDNPYTALLGDFTNGSATLSIDENRKGGLRASGTPQLCPPHGPETLRAGGAIRIHCNGATSTVRATAGGLRAEGSVIPAGAYRAISSRELAHLNGESGMPVVP